MPDDKLGRVQASLRERINREKRAKVNRARAAEFDRAVRVANWRINVDGRRP